VDQVAHTKLVGTLALMGMKPEQGEMVVEEVAMDTKTIVTTLGRIDMKEMGYTLINRSSMGCQIVDTGQCS